MLKLFQLHRRHHGLLCFRQLLAVYSHLSIYSLEHRAQLAGVSIHSGDVIPDERLEADPAAELTVDEAQSL